MIYWLKGWSCAADEAWKVRTCGKHGAAVNSAKTNLVYYLKHQLLIKH